MLEWVLNTPLDLRCENIEYRKTSIKRPSLPLDKHPTKKNKTKRPLSLN